MESTSDVACHAFCPWIVPVFMFVYFYRLIVNFCLGGSVIYFVPNNEVDRRLWIEVLVSVCWWCGKGLRGHPYEYQTSWCGSVDKVPSKGDCRGNVYGIGEKCSNLLDGQIWVERICVHRLCPDVGPQVVGDGGMTKGHGWALKRFRWRSSK